MLFDLRSRGRRRTVQVIYLGLAVVMGGGLVLFGVGAGNGLGGLLNAFTGNGSSGAQGQVVSQQEKTAARQTQLHPTDPSAWAGLVEARWTSAGEGSNYDSTTQTFTASGKKKLTEVTQGWQRYLQLTQKPQANVAILAARAYSQLGNYKGEAQAWDYETIAQPDLKGYECLAASSYAAKQTRKGDLAAAKALSLVPKSSRATIKTELTSAKTNPQIAQSC